MRSEDPMQHLPGLLSDEQIRHLCEDHEQPMIRPYERHLKRFTEDGKQKIVSYGPSSYGYDIRAAAEWKIFQPERTVRDLSSFEKGWVAALLDGEGHIGPHNSKRENSTYSITVGNTNRAILERLQQIIGAGAIYERKRQNPAHKTCYVYRLTKCGDVQYLLIQIESALIEKRERAAEALAITSKASTIVDPKRLDSAAFVEKTDESIIIPPNSFALTRSVECFQMPKDVLGVVLGKSTYARCGIVVNCTPMEPGWRGYLTIEISNTTPLPAKVYANEGIAQVLFFRGAAPCVTSYADRQGKYQDQPAKVILPRM